VTLDKWLRKQGMTEEAFAVRVDDTCTQSLVSKWRRGVVMPSIHRAAQIQAVTAGRVTARGLAARARRVKRKRATSSAPIR
jgi:DNA-binding transcriptional regulator YdaS (Cro superfamily)